MDQINRYYESGDSLIKVLNIIDSTEGSLFICLRYSYNHKHFNIEINNKTEFEEYYEANEINDGDEMMPITEAKHLL